MNVNVVKVLMRITNAEVNFCADDQKFEIEVIFTKEIYGVTSSITVFISFLNVTFLSEQQIISFNT